MTYTSASRCRPVTPLAEQQQGQAMVYGLLVLPVAIAPLLRLPSWVQYTNRMGTYGGAVRKSSASTNGRRSTRSRKRRGTGQSPARVP